MHRLMLSTVAICGFYSLSTSVLLAEKLGPPPKYTDQEYDPLPAHYAEIAKQHVAHRLKIPSVYVRLVGVPLRTAYPVEIDGTTAYRPCWSVLLKAKSVTEEQVFVVYFYKDRVVGTMTTK